MEWKGAVRNIGAVVREAEREAKRRQRELEKFKKTKGFEKVSRVQFEVENLRD